MSDETPRARGPIAWMAGNSVAANLAMLLILVAGAVGALSVKQEVFPEFELDQIVVSVPYPGATPGEVEQGIVLAVEEAVRGIDGVKRVTGTAAENLGTVRMELELSADAETVLEDAKSAVDGIATFPEDAEEPTVNRLDTQSLVTSVVLAGDLDLRELDALAEQLRTELLDTPDITLVAIDGVPDPEIRIEVASTALEAYGLTLDDIARQVGASSVQLSGGELSTADREVLVQVSERKLTGQAMEAVVLRSPSTGGEVTLGEVATVIDAFAETDQESFLDGRRAVRVNAYRTGDETPGQVAAATHAVVEQARATLPDTVDVVVWSDDSKILQERIDLLVENAFLGLVLVVLVLALFLNLRLAFWVSLGIPISFLGAFALMPTTDVSINMISLFAFIITLGTVVDDAIVIGENIYAKMEAGMAPLAAAIAGTQEMAQPVTFAVITSMAAFAPMLMVPGVFGKIFAVFPVIVGLVLLFSLLESFFILPAHLGHIGRDWTPGFVKRVQDAATGALQRFVDRIYTPSLELLLRERLLGFGLALALLIGTIGLVAGEIVPFKFFPDIDGEVVRLEVDMPYGTPRERTAALRDAVESSARATIEQLGGDVVGVYTEVGARTSSGGPAGATTETGAHLLTVEVALGPAEGRNYAAADFADAWEANTPALPGVQSAVFGTPGGPSAGADIELQLAHADPEVLERAAGTLAASMSAYPTLTDLRNTATGGKPQLDLALTDRGRALGMSTQDLARQLRSAIYGAEALREQRGRHELKVTTRLPEAERASLYDLDNIGVRAPGGSFVPLGTVATLTETTSPTRIAREDGRRIETVSADLAAGASSSDVVRALERDVIPALQVEHPGLRASFAGAEREAAESLSALGRGYGIALFVIYALLAIPFRSYTQPLIVMTAIPFGLVGAILGHLFLGYSLSLISLFGLIALSGVVVNDSLVLVHAANGFRAEGMGPRQAVIEAGRRRFRPILLTSLTTFFGLAPMIFETSFQAQFLIPMAISLGFGILFGTFVILLLVPMLYLTLEDVLARFRAVQPEPDPTAQPATA